MNKFLADENTWFPIDVPEWYDPENEEHNIMVYIDSVIEELSELKKLQDIANKNGMELKFNAVERYSHGICYVKALGDV